MNRKPGQRISTVALLSSALLFAGCHREYRDLEPPAMSDARVSPTRLSNLQPNTQLPSYGVKNPYDGNAWAISEGKTLYDAYNCSGCHGHGGGAIGPPLMDDDWIYGNSSTAVYKSIVEGRPQGMPSFGGHIPEDQVWKIAAYVRSLSGLQPQGAVSPRDDHMQVKRWETPK